jgi:hypothetical protein
MCTRAYAPCAASSSNRLIDRIVVLGTHVTHDDATRRTDCLRQCQHLLRLRVDARHIFQSPWTCHTCPHADPLAALPRMRAVCFRIQMPHRIRNLRQMPDRPVP